MRLSYRRRMKLPKRDFAIKRGGKGGKGKYPIFDKSHARNALSRVSRFGTPAEKAEVRADVHKKYPGIGGARHSKLMPKRRVRRHKRRMV